MKGLKAWRFILLLCISPCYYSGCLIRCILEECRLWPLFSTSRWTVSQIITGAGVVRMMTSVSGECAQGSWVYLLWRDSGYTCIVRMFVPWELNLCAANAMLYHWATGTVCIGSVCTDDLCVLMEGSVWEEICLCDAAGHNPPPPPSFPASLVQS